MSDVGIQDDEGGPLDVGSYTLVGKLGQGALGPTYLALQRGQLRKFAIRVLHRHLCEDAGAITLMLHEARTANRLDHPNLARTFDVDQMASGRPYVVTGFVDGPSLDRIGAVAEPNEDGVRYPCALLAGVLSGLGHAHGFGIVHGAITPSDIRVTRDGVPMLLGLDASLIRETLDDAFTPGSERQRDRAPEVLRPGGRASPASDVFSIAVCAWKVLAGPARYTPALVRHGVQGELLREQAPHVPRAVCDTIAAAMSPEPQRRPTVQAFETTLRSAGAGLGQEDLARWLDRLMPQYFEATRTRAPGPSAEPVIREAIARESPGPPWTQGSPPSSPEHLRDFLPPPTPTTPLSIDEPEPVTPPPGIFVSAVSKVAPARSRRWTMGVVGLLALVVGLGSVGGVWFVSVGPAVRPPVSLLAEAQTALAEGRPELAIDLLDRASATDPSVLAEITLLQIEANHRLDLARVRVDILKGRISSADARIRTLLRDHPEDPVVRGMMAEIEGLTR